jgi:hypothetical protein
MKSVWRAQAFDGSDLIDLVQSSERQARIHSAAVDVSSAGPALAMIAALLGSGQRKLFAKTIEQRNAGFDLQIVSDSVHLFCSNANIRARL